MEEQQHNIIGLEIFYSPFTLSHSLCLAGWHGTALVGYSQLVGQFDVFIKVLVARGGKLVISFQCR